MVYNLYDDPLCSQVVICSTVCLLLLQFQPASQHPRPNKVHRLRNNLVLMPHNFRTFHNRTKQQNVKHKSLNSGSIRRFQLWLCILCNFYVFRLFKQVYCIIYFSLWNCSSECEASEWMKFSPVSPFNLLKWSRLDGEVKNYSH